jgi:hypothetical protein
MKVKTKIYIYYSKYPWDDVEKYDVYTIRLEDDEHKLCIGSQEIEIEVPNHFDPRAQQIAALEKQKQKVMADYHKTVTEINNRINNWKAITA